MSDLHKLTKLALGSLKYDELRQEVVMQLTLKNRSKASELLVQVFKAKYKVFTVRDDDTKEVWIYEQGVYVPNGRTYIQEFCREVLQEAFTTTLGNLVAEKIMADTFIDLKEFFDYDKDRELIPVENGIFNLKTGQLEPFDDSKVFFTRFASKYNPAADCPKIKKFLRSIVSCQNDYDVLQELFGWLLYKNYAFERLIMFLGDGRNGKSKMIELIKVFIGSRNACNLPPTMLENPDSFALSALYGKLANLSPDIPKDGLKKTSILKSLSGNDLIEAQRKFKTSITFKNCAKMIFGANTLPMTYDTQSAFWERWILIEFPYKFVTKDILEQNQTDLKYLKLRDEDIIEHITTEAEMSGLFNFAYEGYKRLQKNKGFTYRHSPEDVKIMWLRKSNSFAAFVMDCLEFDYDAKIIKKDLKHAYIQYCQFNKLKPVSDKLMSFILSDDGVTDSRSMINDMQEHIWEGVKFREGIHQKHHISENVSKYDKNFTKSLVFDFVARISGENYHDLCQRFSEEQIKKMLTDGDLIENPTNHIKVNL